MRLNYTSTQLPIPENVNIRAERESSAVDVRVIGHLLHTFDIDDIDNDDDSLVSNLNVFLLRSLRRPLAAPAAAAAAAAAVSNGSAGGARRQRPPLGGRTKKIIGRGWRKDCPSWQKKKMLRLAAATKATAAAATAHHPRQRKIKLDSD